MTAEDLQDLADVRALIQLYIEGSNGDGDKMRQAFHPDAHMFGHIGPMDTYEPITDFTALVEKQPGLAGPNYRADVRTIDLVGDAGVAVLVETDYFGCDFVDYFTVRASMVGGGSRTRRTPTRAARHRAGDGGSRGRRSKPSAHVHRSVDRTISRDIVRSADRGGTHRPR